MMTAFASAALALMLLVGVGVLGARPLLAVAGVWFDAVLGDQHDGLLWDDEASA